MLCRYHDLHIRYPFLLIGSRSFVIDQITQLPTGTSAKFDPKYSLSLRNHRFPLFLKTSERHRFDYAVFLLNKNIEQVMLHSLSDNQVMNHYQIKMTDLRLTLPNLMSIYKAVYRMISPSSPPPLFPQHY